MDGRFPVRWDGVGLGRCVRWRCIFLGVFRNKIGIVIIATALYWSRGFCGYVGEDAIVICAATHDAVHRFIIQV
jgi:hypothetical protein